MKEEGKAAEGVKNRDSKGSSGSNKMQKIQLSVNKNDGEIGSQSLKSNSSYRVADNLFGMDQQKNFEG